MNRCFALLLLLCALPNLFAAEDNRFALVFGNASYSGDAALANAANDAGDMADALTAVGWKVTKLINGDRKAMNRTLTSFRDEVSHAENPTALFYYAGHGVQINGTNYLIPIGEAFESPDDIIQDALSLQAVLQAFEDAKVGVDIIILDACRDNPFLKKNSRALGGTRGLNVISKSPSIEGSAILFSTAPGETASDGTGRNGLFTQVLLKYVKSDLKLQDVATRVTKDVKALSGGKQSPYNSLSLSDDFYLVPESLRGEVAHLAPDAVSTLVLDKRASLTLQKTTLTKARTSALNERTWTGPVGSLGFWTALAGGAAAGYAIVDATLGYNAATTQAEWDAVRDKTPLYNALLTGGAVAAGAGLVTLVVALVFGPDIGTYDRQLADLETSLSNLGAP